MRTDTEELPVLDRGILTPQAKDQCRYCRILLWLLIIVIVGLACLSVAGCAPTLPQPPPGQPAPVPKPVDPLMAYLVYGVLVGVLGVAASVAMLVWLPFKKTAMAFGAGSIALIVTCLTLRSVLPYIEWITLAGVAIGGLVLLYHGRRLLVAARESWKHVPDDAPVLPAVETFMNKIG